METQKSYGIAMNTFTVTADSTMKGSSSKRTCFLYTVLGLSLVVILALSAAVSLVYYFSFDNGQEDVNGDSKPPNVIFILVDDLGFNDVSWNNPEVIMPNLNAMARDGVILDQNYVAPMCSPSRGSIMTGMYPYHIGMQHDVILPTAPECASREHTFLPERLREHGYATHLLGKWHLGFCNWNCTPTYRGFDTFYGFYQNRGDHYNHTVDGGYDWRDGTEVAWDAHGKYSTDLITSRAINLIETHDSDKPMFLYLSYAAVHTPLQAPERFMNMYEDFPNPFRRPYLAMMTALDESVGLITDAMKGRKMMENTVVIFTSDNGGQMFLGSNQPLRGAKSSIYEGGTRVPAFVYGREVSQQGSISNELVHSSDWFPTIVAMAGGSTHGMGLDGVEQTELFFGDGRSHRNEIIYNIDIYPLALFGAFGIRRGDYKLILGFPGVVDGWEQDRSLGNTHVVDVIRNHTLRHEQSTTRHKRSTSSFAIDFRAVQEYIDELGNYAQLFNVRVDPSERVNLATRHPEIVEQLSNRLAEAMKTTSHVHLASQLPDPAGDYRNFGGAWSPGWCE